MSDYINELKEELARKEAEKQALVEEFKHSIRDGWDKDVIKEKIADLLPTAYESLSELLISAESEAVRAALVKYVFSFAIQLEDRPTGEDKDKEFRALIAALAADNAKNS